MQYHAITKCCILTIVKCSCKEVGRSDHCPQYIRRYGYDIMSARLEVDELQVSVTGVSYDGDTHVTWL